MSEFVWSESVRTVPSTSLSVFLHLCFSSLYKKYSTVTDSTTYHQEWTCSWTNGFNLIPVCRFPGGADLSISLKDTVQLCLQSSLPPSVTVKDPSLEVLTLLRLLHSLGRHWNSLYKVGVHSVYSYRVLYLFPGCLYRVWRETASWATRCSQKLQGAAKKCEIKSYRVQQENAE